MTDREKVIKGLKCCTADLGLNQHRDDLCAVCPYKDKNPDMWYCFRQQDLMRDALALLKAQEPRVMTLDEIWKRGDSESLYLEYRLPNDIKLRPAIFQPDNSDEGGGDGYMCVVSARCASGFYNRKEYGKTWRCWTSRPTDEQRKAVKWDE